MIDFVPPEIQTALLQSFEERGEKVNLIGFRFASGGCINQAGQLRTDQDLLFIKWNHRERFPQMFTREADGLRYLGSTDTVKVPKVILTHDTQNFSFLVLGHINSGPKSDSYGRDLGRALAMLHKCSHKKFGLDYDNYIGSLPQENHYCDTWMEFYRVHRIEFQYKMAIDMGKMRSQNSLDRFFIELENIFPAEPPSLLHGDLWSGNAMTDESGGPVLIDPAIYYGHREMDIAFTRMFGGFDSDFYKSYNEVYAQAPGFDSRVDYYNLYPLLVHVNLFGGGYIRQAERILQRF